MRTLFFFVVASIVIACSSSTNDGGGSGSSTGLPCKENADCGALHQCGFKLTDMCQAAGVCFDNPVPTGQGCSMQTPACGCDGSFVNTACTGYPTGYVARPVASLGNCPDAGADAQASDAH